MSQEKLSGVVLCRGPNILAPVWHARVGEKAPPGSVVVVPALSPAYFECVVAKGRWGDGVTPLPIAGLVTERGGCGNHFAEWLVEHGIGMVRVERARERVPEGAKLLVDFDKGHIQLDPKDVV